MPLARKTIVDVGCGTGAFLLDLAQESAKPIGIEIDDAAVERARTAVGGRADVRLGRAEALPLNSKSADAVCYIFSLHHVPASAHAAAIEEAARVLDRGGRLHVADPLPFGAMTEVLEPIDDEREVRKGAQDFLRSLRAGAFRLKAQFDYTTERAYPTLEAVLEHVVRVDPRRAERAADPVIRAEVADRFRRLGRKTAAGVVLEQPCVCFHYERV